MSWTFPNIVGNLPVSREQFSLVTVRSDLVLFGGLDGGSSLGDIYTLTTG